MKEKSYAVFLSFNSEDRALVENIAVYLNDKATLRPWLDQWELIPGEPWVRNLERGLEAAATCAVFVGQRGQGPWQQREVETALRYHVNNRDFRVIPVLLPDAPQQPELPMFLSGNMWVDFRGKRLDDDDALWRLECGIRGVAPGRGRLFSQLTHPTAEQQEALHQKIELLRQENLQKDQIRQTSRRKSVGTKPYVEKLFVDRLVYLEKLTEYVCCNDTRLIMIVGQGGIGKTALAAKFCDEIEKAGYRLSKTLGVSENSESLLIRAIVYVSKTEMAAFTLDQVFAKLAQTLDPDDAVRLAPILKDPRADVALKTERLLDCLRDEPTLLALDNFETALAETMITHAELETFLHTVCAMQHRLTVIITSRQEVNLKAFGVCKKIVLNEGLKIADAVDFLRRLGQEVTQIQQASDMELRLLAEKVHGVPMALRSLAGFLVEREQRRLTVAQLLADETRFAAFKKHDFKAGLRKLIAEQYHILPEEAQLALQAMAVYNAPIKPVAVQYLFPALNAETVLDNLAYDYFLAQHNPISDQFELHPTVQEYAYEQIPERPPESSETPGVSARPQMHVRAADFYAELKKPQKEWKSLPDVQPHLDEIEQRLKAGDCDQAANVLEEIELDYLELWGYSRLVIELREQLVGKLTDDYLTQVNYGNLGLAYHHVGRVKEAIPLCEQALEIARNMKYKQWEGNHLGNLGQAYEDLGAPTQAIEYYTQALIIAREIGDRRGEGNRLGNLGNVYRDVGEPTKAIASYTQALVIAREIGDRRGEGNHLGNLGVAYLNLGEPAPAIDYYTQALAIFQEIGNKPYEGIHTGNLGEAYLEMCVQQEAETWLQQAIDAHQHALEIHKEVGNSQGVPEQYKRLGTAYLFASNLEQSVAYFQCCLAACDQALAQSPLYEVFYYRAFALLALTVICRDVPVEHLSEDAYRKALAVNAAVGVLREWRHEVERLQQILWQKHLDTPDAIAAVDTVLALWREYEFL